MSFKIATVGISGSGKTTINRLMSSRLRAYDFSVKKIKIEDVPGAQSLLSIAKKCKPGDLHRASIFWTLRMQQWIIAQTQPEDIVILDNFWASVIVYDVYGNKIPKRIIEQWASGVDQNKYHKELDLVFFFDLPLEVARSRKVSQTMQNEDFAKRVEKGYREFAKKYRWIRIDATQNPKKILNDCMGHIFVRYQKK